MKIEARDVQFRNVLSGRRAQRACSAALTVAFAGALAGCAGDLDDADRSTPTQSALLVPEGNDPPSSGGTSLPPAGPTNDGSGSSSGSSGGCAYFAWKKQPALVIHLSELAANGGSALELKLTIEAINAIDQLNAVGGTTARVASIQTSNTPFVYGRPFNDGAIHLGFASGTDFSNLVNSYKLPSSTTAMTLPMLSKSGPCDLGEAHILFPAVFQPDVTKPGGWFPNLPGFMWTFETPYTMGVSYYDAGPGYGTGYQWFRPSFLHELLHAFGLVHTKALYAMMNHAGSGGFPWANRPSADAVRPLPYDAYLLRTRYPAADSRWDIAVLGTGMQPPSDPKGDAGNQIKLCAPSSGSSWASAYSSGTCGVDGKNDGWTTVCPGETLYTRYTLANFSTGSLQVTTTLSLSKDETWDATDPVAGTQTGLSTVDFLTGSSSVTMGRPWTAPDLEPGVSYHPIIHVFAKHVNANGSVDPASLLVDSIPLRGLITGAARFGSFCSSHPKAL